MLSWKTRLIHLIMIDDRPSKIAGGAAIGVFFGIMPGGITIALLIAALLRVNIKATTFFVLATNTWSSIVLLPAFAVIGSKMMGKDYWQLFNWYSDYYAHGWQYFFSQVIFYDITLPLIVGMIAVSFLIAVATFLVIHFALSYHKKNIKKKLQA